MRIAPGSSILLASLAAMIMAAPLSNPDSPPVPSVSVPALDLDPLHHLNVPLVEHPLAPPVDVNNNGKALPVAIPELNLDSHHFVLLPVHDAVPAPDLSMGEHKLPPSDSLPVAVPMSDTKYLPLPVSAPTPTESPTPDMKDLPVPMAAQHPTENHPVYLPVKIVKKRAWFDNSKTPKNRKRTLADLASLPTPSHGSPVQKVPNAAHLPGQQKLPVPTTVTNGGNSFSKDPVLPRPVHPVHPLNKLPVHARDES